MRMSILASLSTASLALAGGRRCDSPGTSANPGASRRPMFRHWFPDATVDQAMVAEDIASAGAIGAAGVEFVTFYEYAGDIGPPPPGVDWSTFGFGTEPFKEHFKTALRAHAENGMLMDFALGPGMGHGVPAKPDDEGLQWDLIPFSADVPADGWTDEIIPGWGEGKLVALVSSSVLAVTNESTPAPSNRFLAVPYGSYTQYLLDAARLEDVTDLVSADGRVSVDGPTVCDSKPKRVFAFYEKRTLHRAIAFENNRSATVFDDGGYVVDHYSAKGAQTVINF
ncbi:hypothetical protein NW754_007793 [Fusarium falciforme]|nr:hypothetical protein NW754_007793 [Fusarium falciforme]